MSGKLQVLGSLALAVVLAVMLYRVVNPPRPPHEFAVDEEGLRQAEQHLRDTKRQHEETLKELDRRRRQTEETTRAIERELAELNELSAIRARFEQVKVGMTEAEVKAIMGSAGREHRSEIPVPPEWTVKEWGSTRVRFLVFFEAGKVFRKL